MPLGLLLFIVLFVYALVSTGRKQRDLKRRAFRDFAQSKELDYRESDDGRAQEFARDLDGIGVFRSSSRGDIVPQDVVTGAVDGVEVVLFRHQTHFYEGNDREWFVAGLRAAEGIAERCTVQFLKPRETRGSMYLADPIVEDEDLGPYRAIVRAPTPAAAGGVLEPHALRRLGKLADALPWRPEIQVRGQRIAVYPAGRNDTVDGAAGLSQLLEYAKSAADVLA
jgi:hypothetical protein